MNRSTSILASIVLASSFLGGCASNSDEPVGEQGAAITAPTGSTAPTAPPPPATVQPSAEAESIMVSVLADKRPCESCYRVTGSYTTCAAATLKCNLGVVAVIATLGTAAASEFAALLAAFGWEAVGTMTAAELLAAIGVVGAATAAFDAWLAACQLGYCGVQAPKANLVASVEDSAGIFATPADSAEVHAKPVEVPSLQPAAAR